jgi:hypothetical protein
MEIFNKKIVVSLMDKIKLFSVIYCDRKIRDVIIDKPMKIGGLSLIKSDILYRRNSNLKRSAKNLLFT